MDFNKLSNQLGGKLREGADKLQQKGGELLAKIDLPNLQESGLNAANELVAEFNQSLPLIPEAGYRLREFEVELGLPPKAKAHFELVETISPEAQAEILIKAKARGRMSDLLFSSLFKAHQLQNAIKLGNFKMKEIEIEIGILPAVIVKFQPSIQFTPMPLALVDEHPAEPSPTLGDDQATASPQP